MPSGDQVREMCVGQGAAPHPKQYTLRLCLYKVPTPPPLHKLCQGVLGDNPREIPLMVTQAASQKVMHDLPTDCSSARLTTACLSFLSGFQGLSPSVLTVAP